MLAAADDAAQAAGQAVVWLHVRSADEAAQALYTGFGYEEVDRDAPKLGLFGLGGSGSGSSKARVLMRRRLQPPPAAAAAGA
jgi:ribosomal protein S18 acetylase RimI-like enzyme